MADDERAIGAGRRAYWAAFLIGAALMAGVDEIVFHQILGWHHFYDRSTPTVGLISDGILHAVELFALVGGFFLLADARRRGAIPHGTVPAGVVTGLGAFQLWDGIVDHKVLQVHQVRTGVDPLPYDVAWIGAGTVLLAVGLALTLVVARRRIA